MQIETHAIVQAQMETPMHTLDANIFTRTLNLHDPDCDVCEELISQLSARGWCDVRSAGI